MCSRKNDGCSWENCRNASNWSILRPNFAQIWMNCSFYSVSMYVQKGNHNSERVNHYCRSAKKAFFDVLAEWGWRHPAPTKWRNKWTKSLISLTHFDLIFRNRSCYFSPAFACSVLGRVMNVSLELKSLPLKIVWAWTKRTTRKQMNWTYQTRTVFLIWFSRCNFTLSAHFFILVSSLSPKNY